MENVDNSWQQQTRVICFFLRFTRARNESVEIQDKQNDGRMDGRTERQVEELTERMLY